MGWNGDVVGARSQITATMNSDKEIAANFTSTVGLQTTVIGSGDISGLIEGGLYPVNSSVTLTATPQAGWTFLEWQGAASGSDASISINMDSTKNVTAVFGLPIDIWKARYFSPSQLSDPLISGNLIDFESDGLST